jgi:hypothetical protein
MTIAAAMLTASWLASTLENDFDCRFSWMRLD